MTAGFRLRSPVVRKWKAQLHSVNWRLLLYKFCWENALNKNLWNKVITPLFDFKQN